MSEWWTYRLSSFLLFSPRAYHRLFELYNAAIWPMQIGVIVLGLAIPLVVLRYAPARGRLIPGILAACWLFVAIAFHALRYATINFAAVHFAWAFGLEAALLLWFGVGLGRLTFEWPSDAAGRAGLAIFLFALAVGPLVGLLLGRGWREAELFGVAPDPTAVATLGILLCAKGRGRWLLMIIPVIWCATTGAFLSAMEAPDAWAAPLAAVVAVAMTAWQTRRAVHRVRLG